MSDESTPIPEFYTQGSRKIRGKRGMQNDKYHDGWERIWGNKNQPVTIVDNDVELVDYLEPTPRTCAE